MLLLLLIQCKISLYLGPVQTVRRFVTPLSLRLLPSSLSRRLSWLVLAWPQMRVVTAVLVETRRFYAQSINP